jgi:long-chain acyl-CoA synthetase
MTASLAAIPDTVSELLMRRVQTSPKLRASWDLGSDRRWFATTYADQWREVAAFANGLSQMGFEGGDRLAILAPTCRRWQIAEFGAVSARGVVVGIDAHAAPEQIGHILADSEARWIVVDNHRRLEALPRAAIAKLRRIIVMESMGDAPSHLMTWEALVECGASVESSFQLPCSDDASTLLYTSGTTGPAKGILYTHAQLMVACRSICECFPDIGPGERVLCWLPMASLFQRMMNLVAMACGVETYFVQDSQRIVSLAQEIEPTVFIGVPRFYEKLHDAIEERVARASPARRFLARGALHVASECGRLTRSGRGLPLALRARRALAKASVLRSLQRVLGRKLRFMITGSAAAPIWLLEFFDDIGLPLLEAYGLSENTVPMAMNRPSAFRLGSVGKPLAVNEIRLSERNEVLVRGPGVFRGYHQDKAPGRAFTDDGFYRTGDIARFDSDGFLYLVGRNCDLIKTSTGRRISAAHVESIYAQSAYFDQVAVIGEGRKYLAGLIVLSARASSHLKSTTIGQPCADCMLSRESPLRSLIDRELDRYGADLAGYERIVRYAILPSPLSIAGGELTSTFKVRRAIVAEKYASTIELLYACSTTEGGSTLPQPAAEVMI